MRTLDNQQQLFETWQHFSFITNRSEPLELVEAEHRAHAVVELVIRDLKDQALEHFPSGRFNANSRLDGDRLPGAQPAPLDRAARPARADATEGPNLPAPAARPTRPADPRARRWTLHLPARWPWQHDFDQASARIRALPAPG